MCREIKVFAHYPQAISETLKIRRLWSYYWHQTLWTSVVLFMLQKAKNRTWLLPCLLCFTRTWQVREWKLTAEQNGPRAKKNYIVCRSKVAYIYTYHRMTWMTSHVLCHWKSCYWLRYLATCHHWSYTANYSTFMLAVYPICFDIYNIIFWCVFLFCYKLNLTSRLLSVVVYAFGHFRCLKIFVENRFIDIYTIHYKCGCIYFNRSTFKSVL
jgi:hypothetical protein